MPGVPTIASAGVPDFEAIQWYGIVAPAGTPAAIVERLNAEINRALATPELKARLEVEGAEAAPETPAAFGALIVARDRPLEARRRASQHASGVTPRHASDRSSRT